MSLIVASLACLQPARAEWRDVLPRPIDNGAFLELFASLEHDDNDNSARSAHWTDTFLREKVTVFSNGYVYHPRFLLYQVSLAGALKQEHYRASFLDNTGWKSATGVEYDGRLLFLPEHAYNLELFARRFEPLFKEQAATERNNIETSRGALFQYRQKPFFFHARYNDDSVESGVTTSDVERVALSGEYFNRFRGGNQVSISAAYNPARFSNSLGLDGRSRQKQFNNVIDLQRLKLSVSASDNFTRQDSRSSGRYENDIFGWYEVLSVYFPRDLRADVSYRIQDASSTFSDPGAARRRELSDITKDFQVHLIHRLYQSLDTRYLFMHNTRESASGDLTGVSHSLVTNYTKMIPMGRIQAGMNVGRMDTENEGQADIVNEQHLQTPVPGTFDITQPNAVPQSIAVFLVSPLPPFQTVRLVENVHYTITAVTNTFQINVLTLPPQFVVPGTYDFFVSYSLVTGAFELRTDTFGYNGSVQLFDDLLTPYYSYAAVRSEELQGSFPGTPLDSTAFTAGLRVHKDPIRARGEYQTVDWEVSPYRSWRGEVQLVKAFDPSMRMYLTAAYLTRRYPQGTSSQGGRPYSEDTESVTGNVQKQLFARSMLISAGGSYAQYHGLVDSTAYSLNSAVSWKIGRMDLSVGASAYHSETKGTALASTKRTEQYYYLRLRRELF